MKENTFVKGGHSVTIRLQDEYLNEFLLIMRELTRYGSLAVYDGKEDFWSEKGWIDIGDDDKHVEENKFYIVRVSYNETFCRKRPRREWTVGGFKFTKNVSTETEISTTVSVINAVKEVVGLVFDQVEIVETNGPIDSGKWE